MARGPWAGPKHEFLVRHEHEPSTMISGLGRHEHDIGLCWATISAHSVGPTRHENTQHDAAQVLARGPGAHSAHPAQQIKSTTQPATPQLPIPSLAASHSIRRHPQAAAALRTDPGRGAPPRLCPRGQHLLFLLHPLLLLCPSSLSKHSVDSGGPPSVAVGELHGAASGRMRRPPLLPLLQCGGLRRGAPSSPALRSVAGHRCLSVANDLFFPPVPVAMKTDENRQKTP
jgi:hypothetical protein